MVAATDCVTYPPNPLSVKGAYHLGVARRTGETGRTGGTGGPEEQDKRGGNKGNKGNRGNRNDKHTTSLFLGIKKDTREQGGNVAEDKKSRVLFR